MAWCFRAESARHHAPHPLLRSLIVCASSGAGSGKNAARHKAAPSDSGSRHRSAQDRDAMPATKPSKKVTTIGKRRQIWCSALSFSITYSERSRRGPSLYLRCGDRSFGSVANPPPHVDNEAGPNDMSSSSTNGTLPTASRCRAST